MAIGIAGFNAQPLSYNNKDGIFFSPMDDLSVFLNMTATTDMNYTSPVSVTTNPVMSGANVADNFSRQPKTISINGVVVVGYTGVFLLTQDVASVEDFKDTVELWRDQKRLVKVMCQDGISLDNCVIANFSCKKDKSIKNGLQVEMSFTQIDIVKEATQTTVKGVKTTNANGSKSDAKTTTNAVKGMTQAGKTATQQTAASAMCQSLAGRSVSELSKIPGALNEAGKCDRGTLLKTGSATTYSYTPDAEIVAKIKNMPNAQGVNKNLVEAH